MFKNSCCVNLQRIFIDVHSFDKNPIFLSKLFKKAFVELKLHNYKFVSNKRYSNFFLDKNIDPKINARKIEEIICSCRCII